MKDTIISSRSQSTAATKKSSMRYIVLCLLVMQLLLMLLLYSEIRRPPEAAVAQYDQAEKALVPIEELEAVRRQAAAGLRMTRNFVHHNMKRVMSYSKARTDSLVTTVDDRFRVALNDLKRLDSVAGLAEWRAREQDALKRETQRRFHILQNPKDCKTARKLIATLYRDAGLGSLLQQLINAFMAAYQTGRTFLLASKGWRYSPGGWHVVFQPMSDTCNDFYSNLLGFPGRNGSEEAVLFTELGVARIAHQPLAVPTDIAKRLTKVSDDPGAWWASQFVGYMLRPQRKLEKMYKEVMAELNYTHPIVGVHVRRSDKNLETSYHEIEEYMQHVERYYLDLEAASPAAPPLPRRVYLATDQANLLDEATKKFPHYEFLWHENKSEKKFDRFNVRGLMDMMTDLYLLAHSDFVVCTFSSNVGRVVYELMHYYGHDAANRIVSVDTNFFLNQARNSHVKARFPHTPNQFEERGTSSKLGQVFIESTHDNSGYWQVMVPIGDKLHKRLIPDYKLETVLDVVNVTFPEEALLQQ